MSEITNTTRAPLPLTDHQSVQLAAARRCATCSNPRNKQQERYCSRACLYVALTRPLADRFWAKVDQSAGKTGCWPWTGSRHVGGYGEFSIHHGKKSKAHRVAYELVVGPIPMGLDLDHLCRNRGCVNPAHLEPVTRQVNVLRGINPAAINAQRTHCQRGHPFDEANTSIECGRYRRCLACRREAKDNKRHG